MVLVGLAILLQLAALVLMIARFQKYFVYFYGICALLSLLVVIYIINEKSNPGYKIAWIVPILLFPILGGIIYILFGTNSLGRFKKKKMKVIKDTTLKEVPDAKNIEQKIYDDDIDAGNQSHYISRYAFYPPYENTYTEYLPIGEIVYEKMLEELKKAKKYIFLEYFIIEEGIMWNSILDILKDKAKQGVDVRIIYDDMGSIMTLPFNYRKKVEKYGIKCCVFNPFVPVLSSKLNNRDHRKITVIDGHTGFTGGVNLADEYINAYEKHGHWKDSSIMMKGSGVWSLTVMFLTMWDYLHNIKEDFNKFKADPIKLKQIKANGYVQPYCDSPLDSEAVGETVYFNIINKAKKYVYITSPYLIIDNEMVTALETAAKSGLDIRIITPHIADKWFVHAVTRAYYESLLESGVRIYEYTPGFIHSKTFTADDKYATVGTVNMDYRSLYLHFECGTWLYKTDSVLKIKEDFLKTLEKCQEISLESCKNVRWYIKLGRALLRGFAPLM